MPQSFDQLLDMFLQMMQSPFQQPGMQARRSPSYLNARRFPAPGFLAQPGSFPTSPTQRPSRYSVSPAQISPEMVKQKAVDRLSGSIGGISAPIREPAAQRKPWPVGPYPIDIPPPTVGATEQEKNAMFGSPTSFPAPPPDRPGGYLPTPQQPIGTTGQEPAPDIWSSPQAFPPPPPTRPGGYLPTPKQTFPIGGRDQRPGGYLPTPRRKNGFS